MNHKRLWYLETMNSQDPPPESRRVQRLVHAAGPGHGLCLDHLHTHLDLAADPQLVVAAAVASEDGIENTAASRDAVVDVAVMQGIHGTVEERDSADLTALSVAVTTSAGHSPDVPVVAAAV